MSPIAAQAAMRTAAIRAAGRRQFSVMRSMRSFARSFEPHAFQRLPVTSSAQSPDYSQLLKRTGKSAVVYFPTIFLLLGWPYLACKSIDGHVV